jgi:hypothetical protein
MDIDSDVVKDRLNNRTGLPGAVGSTGNRLNVAPDDEVAIADGQTCAE